MALRRTLSCLPENCRSMMAVSFSRLSWKSRVIMPSTKTFLPRDFVEPPIAEAPSEPSLFLPVELVEEAVEAPSPDAAHEPVAGTLEIALVGGHRLRVEGGYDPEALAWLVRALSEPGP